MAKRTIPIAHLKIGMYLAGIDRSWLLTPFLRHQFLIKDQKDIDALRNAGIAEVVIDTELGLDSVGNGSGSEASAEPILPPPIAAITEPEHHADLSPKPAPSPPDRPSPSQLACQFLGANEQREEWIRRATSLFERARSTGTIDIGEMRHLVDGVMESLLERQAACLAVLSLKQQDPTLQEHGLTTCTLSLALGKALEFSDDAIRLLGTGALLHDIGLVKLPRNIIKRPKTMTPAQQMLYQSHTDLGVEVLKKSGVEEADIITIAGDHHRIHQESHNPPNARTGTDWVTLVSVIDQYDELVTGQTGLPPMSSSQALTQLYQRFRECPNCLGAVSSLIRLIGVYPLYSIVTLNTGEIGIVAGTTPGKSHLPFVYLCRDDRKRPYIPPKPIDLSQESEKGCRVEEVQDPRHSEIDIEQILKKVAES